MRLSVMGKVSAEICRVKLLAMKDPLCTLILVTSVFAHVLTELP